MVAASNPRRHSADIQRRKATLHHGSERQADFGKDADFGVLHQFRKDATTCYMRAEVHYATMRYCPPMLPVYFMRAIW